MPGSDPQPFRFGIRTGDAPDIATLTTSVRMAEDLGYHAALFTDHYLGPGPAMTAANHPIQPFAAIPAATYAATRTTTLRIGFRVLCIDYHQPVVLAKELATIDQISAGRLEVGLGAGWVSSEYEAMGVPFNAAGTRIKKLGQVARLLRAAFGPDDVDIDGDGVHASGFNAVPKPFSPAGPPIAIGGGGRKVLTLAGEVADIVAFNINNASGKLDFRGPQQSTPELTDERVGWVRDAASAAGRPIPISEIGIAAAAVGTDDVDELAAPFKGFFGLPTHDIVDHPHALIGSVDAICDRLLERRGRYGFSYITVRDRVMESFAPVVARLAGT
jgi:probable F420-dependent oxidoreductase